MANKIELEQRIRDYLCDLGRSPGALHELTQSDHDELVRRYGLPMLAVLRASAPTPALEQDHTQPVLNHGQQEQAQRAASHFSKKTPSSKRA